MGISTPFLVTENQLPNLDAEAEADKSHGSDIHHPPEHVANHLGTSMQKYMYAQGRASLISLYSSCCYIFPRQFKLLTRLVHRLAERPCGEPRLYR